MTAGYKKPHISMNRPKYGNKAKVVRKSKAQPKFVKPATSDLKKIYSKLKVSPAWQYLDIFAHAVQWYRGVLTYAYNVSYVKKPAVGYSAVVAKKVAQFHKLVEDAGRKSVISDKEAALRNALQVGQDIAKAHGITAPSEGSYLKQGKTAAKQIAKKEKEYTEKYDKFLTLLSQALHGSGLAFKVSTVVIDRKFDHTVNTMFYSPRLLKTLKKQAYAEGLLSVILSEGWHVARAKAYIFQSEDSFVVDDVVLGKKYKAILNDFEEWARTSKFAPKNIVRRVKERKPKKEASSAPVEEEA